MLTRRTLLGAAGVAPLLHMGPTRADETGPAIRWVKAASVAPPLTGDAGLIATDGLDADGMVRLGRFSPAMLRLSNSLPETVAPSWRGVRGIGDLDGPVPMLQAGGTLHLTLPNPEPGTVMLRAAPSLDDPAGRGAQTVVVVSGERDPPVERDLVLHLGDLLVDREGGLVFGSTPPASATAGLVTINGAMEPRTVALAPRSRVRLRVVNGSAQRMMLVGCSGVRVLIAAVDGQPSDLFAPARDTVPLGPGARYDLLFDMPDASASEVRFWLKPTRMIAGRLEPERDLLTLRSQGDALPPKPPMTAIPANTALPTAIPLERARRVELTIDGQPGTPAAPPTRWSIAIRPGIPSHDSVLDVRRGDAVTFGFVNNTAALVPLRIGGQAVRLLHARDDGWEPYWRDTVLVPPKGRAHVAFVADAPGLWPIESGFDDLTLAGLSCGFRVHPG